MRGLELLEEDVWWAKRRWLRHHTLGGGTQKRSEPININKGGGYGTNGGGGIGCVWGRKGRTWRVEGGWRGTMRGVEDGEGVGWTKRWRDWK